MSISGAHYHERRGRGPSARRAAIAAALLASCVDTLVVELPPIASSIQSVVLVAARPGGQNGDPIYVEAFSLPAEITWPRGLPSDVEITALYYSETLPALGLTPGPLTLANATTRTPRPLPDAAERWGFVRAAGTWRPLSRAELPLVQIEAFLPESCIEQPTACWSSDTCVIPCPAPSAITPPTAPALPIPPTDTDCPTGWALSEPTELLARLCTPNYLDTTCPTGQVRTFDDDSCVPVGPPCPMGQYPEVTTTKRVIWVLPGAVGGDGSLAAPAGSLDEALALAPDGAVVALARGTYVATATITARHELTIVGACPSATVIDRGLHVARSTGLTISGVQLRGPETTAALTLRDSAAVLDGVWIDGRAAGLSSRTSTVSVVASLFTGTPGFDGNAAILAFAGSTLSLDRVEIDGASGTGVRVLGTGTRGLMRRVFIRRALEHGIVVSAASLSAEELVVDDAGATSIFTADQAQVELDRAVLRGNAAIPRAGLSVTATSSVELRRSWLVEHSPSNLVVRGRGRALVERSIVSGQGPGEPVDRAASLAVDHGDLVLEGVSVERYAGMGIRVSDGALTATDLSVVGSRVGEPCLEGVELVRAASSLERVRLVRTRSYALGMYEESADASWRDLTIEDTRLQGLPNEQGAAIVVRSIGNLAVERAAILRSEMVAFDTDGDTGTLQLDDLTIDDAKGGGLHVRNGRQLYARRVSIAHIGGPAAAAIGDLFSRMPSRLDVEDLTIRDVVATTATPMGGLGAISVGLAGGGVFTLRAHRFAISNVEGIGLFAGAEGGRLTDGVVQSVDVGLVVVGDTSAAPLLERVQMGPDIGVLFSRE